MIKLFKNKSLIGKVNQRVVLLILLLIAILLIPLFSNLKRLLFSKASTNTIKILVKIQGINYTEGHQMPLYVQLLNDNQANVKSYPYIISKQKESNIFEAEIDVSDVDLSYKYSLIVKPRLGVRRLFCNLSQTGSSCSKSGLILINNTTYNLAFETLFLGDVSPQDGKVTAGDLSYIKSYIGQDYNSLADINYDEKVDTQDYDLALYSVEKDAQDDTIPWETNYTPTPTSNITSTLTPTAVPTVTPTSAPAATTTTAITNPTNTPTTENCSDLDSKIAQYTDRAYKYGTTTTPKTNYQMYDYLDYKPTAFSIPYRNPNCHATQTLINAAYERMKTYYPGYYQNSSLLQYWELVQQKSIQYNFNPIFVIALWLDESAAGGATNATHFGCDYMRNPPPNNKDWTTLKGNHPSICTEMQCLFILNSTPPDNFAQYACSYQFQSSDYNSTTNTCSSGTPKFLANLKYWYNFLSEGQSEECQIKYCPNAPGCSATSTSTPTPAIEHGR